MNPYVKYLSGYTISAMLGLFFSLTVASFMASSSFFSLALIATSSCFILNLILFWQEFNNILNLPKNLKLSNILPLFLTGCASIIIYALTVFSFYELSITYPIIQMLIPTVMIHFISLCSAIGYFGLYIGDFITTVEKGIKQIPYAEFFLGFFLVSILIASPLYPITLFLFSTAIARIIFPKQSLYRALAITASIILSVNGLGSLLPKLSHFAKTPLFSYLLKAISYIGLFSLTLCDALYCRNTVDYLLNTPPSYNTPSEFFAFALIICNVWVNTQIKTAGKSFLNPYTWLNSVMSFLIMTKSTQKVSKQTEIQPPLAENQYMAFVLLLYNGILYVCFSSWLSLYRPNTYRELNLFFTKPLLTQSITPGTIAKIGILTSHLYLWANMVHKNTETSDQCTTDKHPTPPCESEEDPLVYSRLPA